MKISSLNNYYSFGRNKYIQKGDDIQRKTKNELYAFSPLYASIYYKSANNKEDIVNFNRSNSIILKKLREVQMYRDNVHNIIENNPERNYFNLVLNTLSCSKVGNCEELSVAALSALLLNGFVDAERRILCVKSEFVNKETGEVEYVVKDSLDHVFVVSALGKEVKSDDEKFVIDPWLGFCDTVSGAKLRFKDLSEKREMYSDLLNEHLFSYRYFKADTGDIPGKDEYEQKVSLYFNPYDTDLKKSVGEITEFTSNCFPNLKISK